MTANRIYHGAGSETQLWTPGAANAVMQAPDTAGLAVTDVDVSWFGILTDFGIADQCVMGQWNTVGAQRSYCLRVVNVSGVSQLRFWYSSTGSGSGSNPDGSAVLPSIAVGQMFGCRATRRASDGLIRFYVTGSDPPVWSFLGEFTTGAAAAFFASTANLMINGYGASAGSAGHFPGYFRRAEFRNGFDGGGTVIASPNVTALAPGATSFVDAQGNTWTVGTGAALQAESLPKQVQDLHIGRKRYYPIANGYFRHNPGVGAYNNGMFIANSPTFAPDDLDIRWFGRLPNWAQAAGIAFFSLWDTTTANRSWLVEFGGGQSRLSFSTTGANQFLSTLITMPFAAGQLGGVRFTRRKSDGIITQWFSYDGVSWIPQASTTTAGAGSAPWPSTTQLVIGGYNGGVFSPIKGDTHYAEIRNGIDGPVVFRVGPETFRRLDNNAATFPAESGQTVTRAGTAGSPPWVYPTVKPEDLVDLHNAGSQVWPATPANSGQKAKWGVSQYNDGTKVA